MRDPRDSYLERSHSLWESAHYRHPSASHSLPERLESRDGRAGSFDGQLHPTSPSLVRERTHAHMSHPRARLLAPEPVGGLWLPQPGEYADDRPPPQRRILLQRAGPEEERLIIRRPLSPERHSPADAWYLDSVNGGLAASRRVEYDPRPSSDYPLVKIDGVWRHVPPSSPRKRSAYRRHSPDAGHHSILHAARGATLPREAPESSSRMRRYGLRHQQCAYVIRKLLVNSMVLMAHHSSLCCMSSPMLRQRPSTMLGFYVLRKCKSCAFTCSSYVNALD